MSLARANTYPSPHGPCCIANNIGPLRIAYVTARSRAGEFWLQAPGGHFDNTHVHRTDARCRPRSRLCDCSSGPGVRTGRVSGGKRAVTNPSFVKPRRWFLRLGPLLQSSQIHDVRRHNRPGGNKCCLRSNAPVTKVRRKTQAPWYSDAKIGRHDYCFECLRRRDTSA